MTEIRTVHTNENGEQHTKRVVELEDAAGQTHRHYFDVTEDGHEYAGEGDPTATALKALREWEEADA
jgi:hypothetical protein